MSTRTVLDKLFYNLLTLLAPILCFTSEEAWQSRLGKESSVHEVDFPVLESNIINKELTKKWDLYKQLRKVINGAIEVKRKEKVIGSSLEASVTLFSTKNINEIRVHSHIKSNDFQSLFTQSLPSSDDLLVPPLFQNQI